VTDPPIIKDLFGDLLDGFPKHVKRQIYREVLGEDEIKPREDLSQIKPRDSISQLKPKARVFDSKKNNFRIKPIGNKKQ
jgi:hypothetical protein